MLYGLLSFGGASFNPLSDIPELDGKVILITGGTTRSLDALPESANTIAGNVGLGKQSIIELGKHNPKRIYLCARDNTKAANAVRDIRKEVPDARITYLQCDLADLKSVQSAAKEFVGLEKRLDILILNAGIMATPAATTKQGYEIQFGTNHVGHALLTKLLLPTLLKTAEGGADARVVALSSIGHSMAPWNGIQFSDLKTDMAKWYTFQRYGQSKLANILFVKELARRYPAITAVAVHPGVVNTSLYTSMGSWFGIGGLLKMSQRLVFSTVEQGARNQLWAATGNKHDLKSGEYYTPVGVSGQGSWKASDAMLAAELWEWTENELKGYEIVDVPGLQPMKDAHLSDRTT